MVAKHWPIHQGGGITASREVAKDVEQCLPLQMLTSEHGTNIRLRQTAISISVCLLEHVAQVLLQAGVTKIYARGHKLGPVHDSLSAQGHCRGSRHGLRLVDAELLNQDGSDPRAIELTSTFSVHVIPDALARRKLIRWPILCDCQRNTSIQERTPWQLSDLLDPLLKMRGDRQACTKRWTDEGGRQAVGGRWAQLPVLIEHRFAQLNSIVAVMS
mmetsp:Transcript_138283/g.258067  ORF Transcript_138283/g.258067 Transcript_138283/m.258067 type:complete len:215 (+) Transcript_138283:551-1195(+)